MSDTALPPPPHLADLARLHHPHHLHHLPHLHFLRQTQAQLQGLVAHDAAAAKQVAISSRLLDHMIVQHDVEPTLRRNACAALQALLPDIAVLTEVDPGLVARCDLADPAAFEAVLAQLGPLQARLVALDTPAARALCRALAEVEADRARRFQAAVEARGATARSNAEAASASAARNAKVYDETALLQFIHRRFPAEAKARIVRSGFISGGFSKYTVGIELAGTHGLPAQVILRGDASATFGGTSVVDEYPLLTALHAQGVCLPQPLALEDTGSVFGSPFMLVAGRPGRIIGGPYIDAPPNAALSDDIAAKLAGIHRVPLSALGTRIAHAGGRNSDKVLAWLDEGEAAWRPLRTPSPVFEAAFAWLRRHARLNDDAPQALVHGDFGLHNLLVHDNQVSTILDWEFAHVGNPAYDLGYFHFQTLGLSSWEHFLAAYARSGAALPDKAQLEYHILFAATRIGVMLCQALHGFTSGAEPGLAGAAVLGSNYQEISISRIADALARVL